jgi:hypothetical protein
MEQRLAPARTDGAGTSRESVARAIREVLSPPARAAVRCRHSPPAWFRPGEPLSVELTLEANEPLTVRLHYRHANQAEDWRATDAENRQGRYRAVIPADYTESPYPLLYYFEGRGPSGVWLYPGFGPDLSNEPYLVVRKV